MNKKGMASAGRAVSTAAKVLWGLVAIIGVIAIWFIVAWLIKVVPKVGTPVTSTPITNIPQIVESFLGIVLDMSGTVITVELLILHLAIFVIIFFAMSDIIALFSTFSETTSWVIGFGLAVIAGVTNVIGYIAGIMGIAAGIGAIGILLIIIGAVASAVTLNLGIGGAVRRWRLMRDADVRAFKAEAGGVEVAGTIRALKKTGKAYGEK